MTMETFNDLLHRLQEVHEQEMEGWQLKVKELSNKKGCDSKRMEELFTKNQQMKEQHRLLTENIKTLENRLRAGLCDRCTVTQEVAKKRQQEYEASQIQSLQHISILAGEMTNLKKENLKLKDELRALKATLDRRNSDHSSSSGVPRDVKPSSPPDRPPSSDSVTLVSVTPSRTPNQPADSDVLVKTEADQRGEETERRQLRGTNRDSFDLLKPPPTASPPSWKPEQPLTRPAERRAQSVEGLDQHSCIPPQPPRKHSSSSPGIAVKPHRPVVHSLIPCHPQPIRSSPMSMPWPMSEPSDWAAMAAAGTNLMGQSSSQLHLPHFPNLIPPVLQTRKHGYVPPWPKQRAPQPPAKEPTVVFRLRNLTESPTKLPEKKESPPLKPERVPGESLKDACDGPLDLSDRGKSKPSQTLKHDAPVAFNSDVRTPKGSESDGSPQLPETSPSLDVTSSSCSTAATQEPSSDQNQEVTKEQDKIEKTIRKTDQSNGKKVPVLTLSLRPAVVMLETLNSALQKEESISSNSKSSSPANEADSSSDEADGSESGLGKDFSRVRRRKRTFVETETDRESDTSNILRERRIKITVRSEERSPS